MNKQTTVSDDFFVRFCPDPCAMYDLGELHAEFNAKFFQGQLPIPLVVERLDGNGELRRVYPKIKWEGRYKKLWGTYKANGRGSGEIRLARICAADPTQVRSTLLHEMLHAFLDKKGLDDGIKGHGKNFITHAKRINDLCENRGVKYRVNYYNDPVTLEQPQVESELLKTTIYLGEDLDVAKRMRALIRSAFDENSEISCTYRQ